jgi:hypothetical protein
LEYNIKGKSAEIEASGCCGRDGAWRNICMRERGVGGGRCVETYILSAEIGQVVM